MTQRFAQRADEFIARIRAAPLDSATEFVLTYYCTDQAGNPLPPIHVSLTPTTQVNWPGNLEAARRFAAALLRDGIVGNINSLVRAAPEGPILLRERPEEAVTIQDFTLDIIQPDDPVSLTRWGDAPFLREGDDGELRVGKSRVLVDLVIRAFQDGATPEAIVQRYPALSLGEVYASITFYLNHRPDVEEYLDRREREADEIRRQVESRQKDLPDIRSRLLARRAV
jgi:uncharacterized protein (DUF433 family)